MDLFGYLSCEERLLVLWRSISAWADLILQWANDNALIGRDAHGGWPGGTDFTVFFPQSSIFRC